MHSLPRPSAYSLLALFLAAMPSTVLRARAAELMPVAQQNALVQKYCAVCHTDAAKNGGLSLEHFDAANASPGLKAMMLSKLTGGVLMRTAADALTDPGAAALVNSTMRTGAAGAAGLPTPDKPVIEAWIHAFAVGAAGATDWAVERSTGVTTASVLREMLSTEKPGQAEVYRFIASCNSSTKDGYLQLAWAPVARAGTIVASVDGRNALVEYRVEGSESMGNNSGLILHGPAAWMLGETRSGGTRTGLPFPAEKLTVSDLFPGEVVTFSFSELPKDARQDLSACFPDARAANRH